MQPYREGEVMKRALVVMLAAGVLSFVPHASAVPPTVCFGADTNDNRSTDSDDFLTGSLDDDVSALGDGNDQYFASDGQDSVCGNVGDDVIVGEGGSDNLNGGYGDDTVQGMSGADVLIGGPGSDTLVGNMGADILRGAGDGFRDELYDGDGPDIIT